MAGEYNLPYFQKLQDTAVQRAVDQINSQNGGGAAAGMAGAAGGKTPLQSIFQGTTAPYNASAPVYSRMPTAVNMPAFMPGQAEALAAQLSAGYGQPASAYQQQMQSVYAPMRTTRLYEPITQTARMWGLKPTGQPGGWQATEEAKKKAQDKNAVGQPQGFNGAGYQQWGMDTGSPFLNSIFGVKSRIPGQEEIDWMAAEKAKTDAMSKKQLGKYTPPTNPWDVKGY